jgi:transmembrane sensor
MKTPERDIVAEASAWFVEFREGTLSQAVRTRFDEWLRRSPEHIQAYLEISAAWSELPTSDPERRIDVDALVARARSAPDDNLVNLRQVGSNSADADAPVPLRSKVHASRLARRTGGRRVLFASAAALAFIALGLGFWFASLQEVYSTGVGEERTIRLADGSTVELNALSEVRVRLSKDVRDIELRQGQALFHVAKDRARPFLVRSSTATVRAVGTQFDVYRQESGTTVTVVEGQVAVLAEGSGAVLPPDTPAPDASAAAGTASPSGPARESAAPAILLSAGEQVTVTPRQISKPKKTDVAAATGWTEHRLVFESTPLSEVAREFNRYNTKKLVITDPTLRTIGISGLYSSADPESLIGFLRAQPTLLVTETASEIRVSRRESR